MLRRCGPFFVALMCRPSMRRQKSALLVNDVRRLRVRLHRALQRRAGPHGTHHAVCFRVLLRHGRVLLSGHAHNHARFYGRQHIFLLQRR